MARGSRSAALFVVIMCLGGAWAAEVEATLGERVQSIDSDRRALSAVRSAETVGRGYTIHEIRNDAGLIREYVSPEGIVFGVAWNGLAQPDLSVLLGSYHGEYENARKQLPRPRGKRQMRVQSDRVVVETWGHVRNIQGRAFVPELIPSGLNADVIK